jgi:hypothetical protein
MRKEKIAKKLEKELDRKPLTAKEKRLHAASAEFLSGAKMAEVESAFAVQRNEIELYLKKVFPDENARYQFLEEIAITNATLAAKRFTDCFGELSAEGAAKAFAIFSGKAVEIKKAREAGFKEQSINPQILIQLQQTLEKVTPAKVIDIDT